MASFYFEREYSSSFKTWEDDGGTHFTSNHLTEDGPRRGNHQIIVAMKPVDEGYIGEQKEGYKAIWDAHKKENGKNDLTK